MGSADLEADRADRRLVARVHRLDVGAAGTPAAPRLDDLDGGRGAFEDDLDPAVGEIAHRARDAVGGRLGPAALPVPDALHPARDEEPTPHEVGRGAQTWQASQ